MHCSKTNSWISHIIEATLVKLLNLFGSQISLLQNEVNNILTHIMVYVVENELIYVLVKCLKQYLEKNIWIQFKYKLSLSNY